MAKHRPPSHHSSHHNEGGAKVNDASDNDPAEEQANNVQPVPASCWDRFRAEINPCQSWFLKTHPAHDRPLDITSAFAPEGIQPLLLKVCCGGFVWATAIYSLVRDRKERGFWLVLYLYSILCFQ